MIGVIVAWEKGLTFFISDSYFLSAGAGFVLSSTNLNLDNCLYAKNTMNAIIRKLIILPIR